ncbi:hypothetical protein D3C86_1525070 [compost metagenome]
MPLPLFPAKGELTPRIEARQGYVVSSARHEPLPPARVACLEQEAHIRSPRFEALGALKGEAHGREIAELEGKGRERKV